VAEQGQRRKLEAILSADVVGYSRLMQDDDAATVETLTKYRAIFNDFVSRHEGRIVDSPGDNILAEFDSPVEAVQCAVELQREFARRNRQLAEHRQMQFRIGINLGDILSRDDGTIYGDGVNVAARLEALAEPGGIMISESARMQVRSLIDVSIADAGEHEVKNIAEPVHVYRIVLVDSESNPRKPRKLPRALMVTTAAVALVIVIVAGVMLLSGSEPEDPVLVMPTGPVIAVLPFDNMSGDPEQEYFSDGISEDIITRLARFPDIRVIARNSSFQYKGENVDIRNIAEDLGATYVLEGSVRRSETAIRVTAQLLDATDGTHVWAETYDRELTAGNVFAIQDDLTDRVVGAIGGSGAGAITQAVVKRTEMAAPEDLRSYECVIRAQAYWRLITPAEHLRVRTCLERVVESEPGYGQAAALLAHVVVDEYLYGFNKTSHAAPPLDRALAIAEQSIHHAPESSWAHWARARVSFYRHDLSLFRSEGETSIALAPNNSQILASVGHFLAYSGDWDEGMALMNRAVALNPRHQTWYHFPYFYDAYRQGLDDEALAAALRLNMPQFFWTHTVLAAGYGQLGMTGEAVAAVAALHEAYPGYTIQTMAEQMRVWNFEANLIDRMAEGLRKAGVAEK